MSQTYDVTMTEDARKTLLLVTDEAGTEGGLKGARRQSRAATALESYRLKRPVAVEAKGGSGEVKTIAIPPTAPVVVRLTHENVEVILESAERACKPVTVQGPNGPVQTRPALLVVRGMRIIDAATQALEAIKDGKANETEGVEVIGLNGTGEAVDADPEVESV